MTHRLKRNVLILLSLFAIISSVFAKEVVTIRIDGEEYVRDMPTTIEEATPLINTLADMINESDDHILSMEDKMKAERETYKAQIKELQEKLKAAEAKTSEVVEKVVYVEKEVNKVIDKNTRFTPYFLAGPVIGSDLNFGLHVEVGGLYRTIKNLHIGGSLFSSVYNNSNRNFDIGFGLAIGYSFY